MQATDAARFSWTGTELYRELCNIFPQMRTTTQNVLDVELLAERIGMTKEGVYKWLRAGRILSKKGVEQIVSLAGSEPYKSQIEAAGRQPPTKQELARFLLS